jgi:hypothetical protein
LRRDEKKKKKKKKSQEKIQLESNFQLKKDMGRKDLIIF